ncbi:MAG: tetratricopeptide repeat protein [Terracidiphilus sp.]|jgi:tetratricopeptide (TPR) repeat protein
MERIDKTVFISYRRTNIPWALAIFQNLTHYGYDVFFDYNGIPSGDFEGIILGNITARAHFLVLLTPSALERCGESGDWLRREIETALDTRRNIVPLMLEGFDFGTPKIASQLTGKLVTLKGYNGLSIPPDYFLEAMDRLRNRFLNVPLTAVLHPASLSAQVAATEQKAVAEAAPQVQQNELTAQQWYERGFNAVDLDEKLRFYSEAIRLKPDYVEAFVTRGNIRYELGDLDKAIKDYNEAIRLKPDYALAFRNRGGLLYIKCDFEGAIKDEDAAIHLNPDYAEAFANRGIARSSSGDLIGALKDHNEAIRLKPELADAFNNRGNTLRQMGDYEEALKDCNEAIHLKTDFAVAFDTRGVVRAAMGDLEGALKDHNEAIRLSPKFAEAYYDRSITRDAIGDREGAQADYGEAIRLGFKPKS